MSLLGVSSALGAGLEITSFDRTGSVAWSGAFTVGVVTVETKSTLDVPWRAQENYFTSNSVGAASLATQSDTLFCRLLVVDISTNTPRHFTNLIESYGWLETIAGRGQFNQDKQNNWRPEYEGGPATNANLSRPHIVFANPANHLLLVDEGSGSVLRITPAGTIHTFAGTHTNGFNGDGPAPATNLHLHFPNGGWMRDDGTLYILDTYNGRVRRVDTNGTMSTLFTVAGRINEGRSLWVKEDESILYFGNGTNLMKWTPTGGVEALPHRFLDLGNIVGDETSGVLYVTDRDAHRVYRLLPDGTLTPVAGNGTTSGGGDGFPALQTGLNRPRALWFLPNGGGFIGEHSPGNRVWYVDPGGIIHLWMNGDASGTRPRGDGQWFYADLASPKVSKVRSLTTDRMGNLLIVENDYGYVRRVQFRRLVP